MRPIIFRNLALLLCSTPAAVQGQWTPFGALTSIPQVDNCMRTGGDIAFSAIEPTGLRVIYYCSTAAAQLNALTPDAGHFYFVHEYGHQFLNSSDEAATDRWAAAQLANAPNGAYYLNAMIRHLILRVQSGEGFHPRYGTPWDRMLRIKEAAEQANPSLQFDETVMQFK